MLPHSRGAAGYSKGLLFIAFLFAVSPLSWSQGDAGQAQGNPHAGHDMPGMEKKDGS